MPFHPSAHNLLINYIYWKILNYYDSLPQSITSEMKFPANKLNQFTHTGKYTLYGTETLNLIGILYFKCAGE